MDGMSWEELPEDIKQELAVARSSQAETQAEAMWVTKEYKELMDLYESVEASNRAFMEQCRTIMKELEEENFGDA